MSNLSQVPDPLVVSRDSTSGTGVTADDFRFSIGGLGQSTRNNAGTYAFPSGVFPNVTVNGTITDCQCTATSPASLGANVNFGNWQVARSFHGIYLGAFTAPVPVTFATANGSNPRIDYVIIRVRDAGYDSSVTRTADVVVLTGTPAGSPAEPTGQLTDGDFLLAAVTIRTGTSSVLASDISDRRVFVTARGGIVPKSAVDTANGAYPGQVRFNLATRTYEGWDTTVGGWVSIASSSPWSSFSPVLYASIGTAAPPGSQTTMSLGTGSTVVGRYQVINKTLFLSITWTWGTPPYNGFTGAIYSYLPSGILSRATGEAHLPAKLVGGTGTFLSLAGECRIPPNSAMMVFYMPFSKNDATLNYYSMAQTQGVANTGNPITGNSFFAEGGTLTVNGVLEVQ